ncbi:uncharacterized protein KY384_002311 [Bacidia gigantensis]|uniref:uncharacterized protein n=1 Tax=Bacidia gigantensis TaxID=2732470 RepID=UPI001D049B9E|nr:uncharacterized protein KY384_002311 [Bacidia gigantensis]KAG8532434.1 hypothetical protein KY384_002311 [Bacidia gigantensis]
MTGRGFNLTRRTRTQARVTDDPPLRQRDYSPAPRRPANYPRNITTGINVLLFDRGPVSLFLKRGLHEMLMSRQPTSQRPGLDRPPEMLMLPDRDSHFSALYEFAYTKDEDWKWDIRSWTKASPQIFQPPPIATPTETDDPRPTTSAEAIEQPPPPPAAAANVGEGVPLTLQEDFDRQFGVKSLDNEDKLARRIDHAPVAASIKDIGLRYAPTPRLTRFTREPQLSISPPFNASPELQPNVALAAPKAPIVPAMPQRQTAPEEQQTRSFLSIAQERALAAGAHLFETRKAALMNEDTEKAVIEYELEFEPTQIADVEHPTLLPEERQEATRHNELQLGTCDKKNVLHANAEAYIPGTHASSAPALAGARKQLAAVSTMPY